MFETIPIVVERDDYRKEEIKAGAIRLRDEEEQVNKRQETQANRKNKKSLPSQAS